MSAQDSVVSVGPFWLVVLRTLRGKGFLGETHKLLEKLCVSLSTGHRFRGRKSTLGWLCPSLLSSSRSH